MYATLSTNASNHIKEYYILGECVFLDHLLVLCKIELVYEKEVSGRYMVNSAYLKDPLVVAALVGQ